MGFLEVLMDAWVFSSDLENGIPKILRIDNLFCPVITRARKWKYEIENCFIAFKARNFLYSNPETIVSLYWDWQFVNPCQYLTRTKTRGSCYSWAVTPNLLFSRKALYRLCHNNASMYWMVCWTPDDLSHDGLSTDGNSPQALSSYALRINPLRRWKS